MFPTPLFYTVNSSRVPTISNTGHHAHRPQHKGRYRLIFCLLCLSTANAPSAEHDTNTEIFREIALDSETDITVQIYPANGPHRILWIPAYATPQNAVQDVALQLNQLNIEVWYADLLEARFLPKTSSSIYKIKEKDIISIINVANQAPKKKLFVFAESRAVIPALLAIREKQLSEDAFSDFGGVIMNSPYFYVETPKPGVEAQLMPITSATNLPIYIFQPKDSPRFWQLNQSIPALEKSGSDVFVQVLAGIRGRFLFRPDSTPKEDAITQSFGKLIAQAVKYLETVNHKTRRPNKQKVIAIRSAGGKKDRSLQIYQGNPNPPALMLKNLSGRNVDLQKFTNHVVLVNFWASWCPPCVEEMPSLQRLGKKLPEDKFTILGVNIAEDPTTIKNFLSEQVKVDFPILLDGDGNVMRQWNVMAFPTSFVIDKNGKIRYALFGSIDWDTVEIIKTLQTLLDE